MAFGKSRHTDAKAPPVRMNSAVVEFFYMTHQIRALRKGIGRVTVMRRIARRVATQRQDIANSIRSIGFQNRVNLSRDLFDTSQMWNGIQRGVMF